MILSVSVSLHCRLLPFRVEVDISFVVFWVQLSCCNLWKTRCTPFQIIGCDGLVEGPENQAEISLILNDASGEAIWRIPMNENFD